MGEPRIIDWFVEICAMGGLVMEGERDSCDPCGGGQREPWVWKGIRDFCEGRERENALDLERKKRLGVEEREAFGKDEDSDFREREREK